MCVLQLPLRICPLYLLQLHLDLNKLSYLDANASELFLLPELSFTQSTFEALLLLADDLQLGFELGFPVGGLFAGPPDLRLDQPLFLGDQS
jgi:hypothetical protein